VVFRSNIDCSYFSIAAQWVAPTLPAIACISSKILSGTHKVSSGVYRSDDQSICCPECTTAIATTSSFSCTVPGLLKGSLSPILPPLPHVVFVYPTILEDKELFPARDSNPGHPGLRVLNKA